MEAILDKLGRPIRDLRISVTDRCNFRCTYCMPKEVFGDDYVFLPKTNCCHLRRLNDSRNYLHRSAWRSFV